jgi:RNA polymerase sigma factor (sigma-70 family)
MEADRGEARVAAVMAAHGDALRRVARRYSAGTDDAEDALQRGLEIYVRRLARVDPATEAAWLKVVVKNEALAVRRGRGEVRTGAGEDVCQDAPPPAEQRSLEELLAGRERARRVAEALKRLKPDEARALLLKADGLSYREIAAELSWSYTKVNRCLTEGRKRFFELYAEIEAGAACERVAPALLSLARGSAGVATMLELRPHLRHCAACRGEVRRIRQPFSAPRVKAPTMNRWSSTKSTMAGSTAMTLPAARMPVELVA